MFNDVSIIADLTRTLGDQHAVDGAKFLTQPT
jgi:hypothetical protein